MMTLALNAPFQKFFFRGDPMTEAAAQTDSLMMFLWWHSVFWFILLMGLTLYFVVRYRRVPGKPAEPSASHNLPLETFWTVVPTLILVVIFVLGFWGYVDKVVPQGDAMELNVKGVKWSWSMTYPNGFQSNDTTRIDEGGREIPVFYLPENHAFSLRMSSEDVIHSFWIPDLRVKMDVFPNRYTGYGFTTPELDDATDSMMRRTEDTPMFRYRDLWVFCAEYCGDDHAEMAAIIRVVPKPVFDTWVTNFEVGPDTGRSIFNTRCATCHTNDGRKLTGPTWLGGAEYDGQVYGYGYPVNFTDGTSLEARDANYVRESILDPAAKIVAGFPGTMTSFDGLLNQAQLESVIMYYQSLSDRGPSLDDGALDSEGSDTTDDSTDAGGES